VKKVVKFSFVRRIFLFLGLCSVALHFYISFFNNIEACSWNRGIVLGLVAGLNPLVLSLILFLILALLSYFLLKQHLQYSDLIIVFFVSSLAHIVDRLAHGGVCDYIKIELFFDIPVFNFNDIFILLSLIFLFTLMIYDTVCCEEK
jgi:lipoprotein signal peptidase